MRSGEVEEDRAKKNGGAKILSVGKKKKKYVDHNFIFILKTGKKVRRIRNPSNKITVA